MQRLIALVCFFVLPLVLGGAASAQSAPSRIVEAEIVPGWRNADGTHIAGLRLTLAPGWKTYWRVPGEAGIPPVFSWRGSRNLRGAQVIWPTPKVFDQAGTQSIGYENVVILPIAAAPRKNAADITLNGRVQIGVCLDICIPETIKISATLPTDGTRAPELVAAMVDRPFSADEAGVSRARCRVSPIEGGVAIEARIDMPSAGAPEAVVIEPADAQLYVTQAHTTRAGGTLSARAKVYHVDGGAFSVARDTMRLTVIGAQYAVDIRGCSGF